VVCGCENNLKNRRKKFEKSNDPKSSTKESNTKMLEWVFVCLFVLDIIKCHGSFSCEKDPVWHGWGGV